MLFYVLQEKGHYDFVALGLKVELCMTLKEQKKRQSEDCLLKD
jgi:hypothetical protein